MGMLINYCKKIIAISWKPCAGRARSPFANRSHFFSYGVSDIMIQPCFLQRRSTTLRFAFYCTRQRRAQDTLVQVYPWHHVYCCSHKQLTRSLPVPSVYMNDLYLWVQLCLKSFCDQEGSADGTATLTARLGSLKANMSLCDKEGSVNGTAALTAHFWGNKIGSLKENSS